MDKQKRIKQIADDSRKDIGIVEQKPDPVALALAMHKNEGKRKRVSAHRKSQAYGQPDSRRLGKRNATRELQHCAHIIKNGLNPHETSHKTGSVDNKIAYTSFEMFNRDYEMGKFDVEGYRPTGVKHKPSGRKSVPSGYTSTKERGSLAVQEFSKFDPHKNMDNTKEVTEVKQELK